MNLGREDHGEKNITGITLPQTNSSHLKMDGGKTSFLLGRPVLRCYVSFREGIQWDFSGDSPNNKGETNPGK